MEIKEWMCGEIETQKELLNEIESNREIKRDGETNTVIERWREEIMDEIKSKEQLELRKEGDGSS